jgi:hypothetical protein
VRRRAGTQTQTRADAHVYGRTGAEPRGHGSTARGRVGTQDAGVCRQKCRRADMHACKRTDAETRRRELRQAPRERTDADLETRRCRCPGAQRRGCRVTQVRISLQACSHTDTQTSRRTSARTQRHAGAGAQARTHRRASAQTLRLACEGRASPPVREAASAPLAKVM